MIEKAKLSLWDAVYALDIAIACAISYWVITYALHPFTDRDSDLLGGMWAVASTIFVFRETREDSLSAGIARLIATCVSFSFCLLYLLIFKFTVFGMATLVGIGTIAMILLNRRADIVTTSITTAVVMVVAGMSPPDAWHQPLLRLIDTVVGIAVGVVLKSIASSLFFKVTGQPVR